MRTNPFEPPSWGLSLYIHVPFCERKCCYCAFESAVPGLGDCEKWLNLLNKELDWWNSRIGRPLLNTCYIGGGTPTVLNGPQWLRLTQIIDAHFRFAPDAEVTVEANPNSLITEHLLTWRDWRVSRVSIGVQSFDDAELKMLGRLHSASQAYCAISSALAGGFAVSADLMFGLPHQTFENWCRSLKDAVSSGIHHISLYQLSLEAGTPWENMPKELLSDGYLPYRWAQWYMSRKGFNQYEVANFAKAGYESRHNLNYWRSGEYLGVGAGASGCLCGWRYKNTGVLKEYEMRLGRGLGAMESGERLDRASAAKESAVLALRTTAGIDNIAFIAVYGKSAFEEISETLKTFPRDLYTIDEQKTTLTKKGMRVANAIWTELV